MKQIDDVIQCKEIKIIDDKFQKLLLGGNYCPCTVYVPEMKQKVVGAHYLEVDPY